MGKDDKTEKELVDQLLKADRDEVEVIRAKVHILEHIREVFKK